MRPSLELMFQWASEVETIKGHNVLLNKEAVRFTQLFKEQGAKSALLKGPANARLYPNPYARQAGVIDIWLEGGRERVIERLEKLGLKYESDFFRVGHHVHLDGNHGITVEVHFKPSSGTRNPFTNHRLQAYLNKEIQTLEYVPEGFYIPSIKFALVMQLAHIQHHFLGEGVGLKQLVDYYVLLQHASDSDRAEISSNLKKFGLRGFAGALMWILGRVFNLDESKMLCKPNKRYGTIVLNDCFVGGNFGVYKKKFVGNFVQHWIRKKKRVFWRFRLSPAETFWDEIWYWREFFKSIPFRVRMRRVSIRDLFE
jgi:hypothetical protein